MTLTAMACQADMADSEYAALLEFQDIVIRAAHNAQFSAHYFRMFVVFIDDHPEFLQQLGLRKEIEVKSIRDHAGKTSESTGTRFFEDLDTIGAIKYESPIDETTGRRRSFVTSLSSLPYPETFDTNTPSRARRAKEAKEKADKQFKDPRKLWKCEVCGGELVYDATPHCPNPTCLEVYPSIKNIPASDITIEAEVIEVADGEDWLNSWDTPTIEVKTVRPGAIQSSLPETPIPPSLAPVGRHRRGIACPDCHSLNHWQARPTEYGETIDICTICYPE